MRFSLVLSVCHKTKFSPPLYSLQARRFSTFKAVNGEQASKLRIQIMSDLHIEFLKGKSHNIIPKGFSEYKEFVVDQARKFEKVLVVLGNHGRILSHICRASFETNTRTLQQIQEHYSYAEEFYQIGWSEDFRNHVMVDPRFEPRVALTLADYHYITLGSRKLCVSDTNSWFREEVQWLSDEIQKAKEQYEPVMVMTHPKYNNSPINSAFCSNLEFLLGPPVKVWAYGHTHFVQDIMRNGTRVLSNSCGYPGQDVLWNPELVVEIDSKESQ